MANQIHRPMQLKYQLSNYIWLFVYLPGKKQGKGRTEWWRAGRWLVMDIEFVFIKFLFQVSYQSVNAFLKVFEVCSVIHCGIHGLHR